MIEDNRWVKPVISVYLVSVTILVNYFSTKLWAPWLKPYERFTMVILSSLAYFIFMTALYIHDRCFKRDVILYHGLLFLVTILMLFSYQYRPIAALYMMITIFGGLEMGLLANITVTVASSLLYCADQAFLYGTILIGVFACAVAYYRNDKIKLIISSILYFFAGFFINGMFQYYYTGNGFGFKFALTSIVAQLISYGVFLGYYFNNMPNNYLQYAKDTAEPIKTMKSEKIALFYHAVEVAELSVAGAKKIQCDRKLVFSGGMLHDIGKIEESEDYIKTGLEIANECEIPKEIKSIIVEHSGKIRCPKSKESAIVMLADSVVSTIEHLREERKADDEEKIIDNVFSIRLAKGFLDESGLRIKELSEIKKGFKDFYDRKEKEK